MRECVAKRRTYVRVVNHGTFSQRDVSVIALTRAAEAHKCNTAAGTAAVNQLHSSHTILNDEISLSARNFWFSCGYLVHMSHSRDGS